MKVWAKIACLSLAAFAAPAHAAERDVLVLEPTSEWVLDYAEERCSFYRTYGQGDEALTLRIDSFGSATDYRFLVMGPSVPNFSVPTTDMTIRFTPDAEDREIQGLNGKAGEQPAVSFSASFLPYEEIRGLRRMSPAKQTARMAEPIQPDPQFEIQVRTIEMRFSKGPAIQLKLGPMARPLAAMRDCLDNLQTSWGLDPVVFRGLTRLAAPRHSTVRRVQRDYPSGMLWRGSNAYVPVRVMVNVQGETTACVVQVDQIPEPFKQSVCSNLARGYKPALDSEGNAVASMFQTSVFYLVN